MSLQDVEVTVHDRLMRAWEYSMELTRDFQIYSQRVPDEKIAKIFKEFAEDEAVHAQKFRSLLLDEKSSQ